jgi:hypothetical protein
MMIEIERSKLMKIIEDVLREMLPRDTTLAETCPLPPAEKKRRKKEREQDTKERRRDAERQMKRAKKIKQATNPMEDVMNTFRTFANGVMEEEAPNDINSPDEILEIEIPDEDIDEASKKKKKKNCGGLSGSAVYRDANGHFSSKKDAKVFTIKKYKGSDCRHGTTRVKGNNDSIATSLPCGAEDATSKGGTGQHKKRCKDGSDKW